MELPMDMNRIVAEERYNNETYQPEKMTDEELKKTMCGASKGNIRYCESQCTGRCKWGRELLAREREKEQKTERETKDGKRLYKGSKYRESVRKQIVDAMKSGYPIKYLMQERNTDETVAMKYYYRWKKEFNLAEYDEFVISPKARNTTQTGMPNKPPHKDTTSLTEPIVTQKVKKSCKLSIRSVSGTYAEYTFGDEIQIRFSANGETISLSRDELDGLIEELMEVGDIV